MQDHLFTPGNYTEMWPKGPDSIRDLGPRNIRIAHIEDRLLDLANLKRGQIELIPEPFDAESAHEEIADAHVLAICEGSRSRTFAHFSGKFGAADHTFYGLDGEQVSDMVLGLRVKSLLPDPMAVLLTVAQNRFLLNSLRGEGFLNMRLTTRRRRKPSGSTRSGRRSPVASSPSPACLSGAPSGEFVCGTHHTLFLPALLRGSAFWSRVLEGLALFGVPVGEPDRRDRLPAEHGATAAVLGPVVPAHPDDAGYVRLPAWRRGQRHPLLARARPEQRAGVGHLPGPVPG